MKKKHVNTKYAKIMKNTTHINKTLKTIKLTKNTRNYMKLTYMINI